jgi:hypothetical protein
MAPLLDSIEVDESLRNDACGEPQAWLAYSMLCKGVPLKQFAQSLRLAAIKQIEHVGWKLARDPHWRRSYILIESCVGSSWFTRQLSSSKRTFSTQTWSP